MKVQRYSAADKTLWDDLVSKSKNGTFMFRRDYMDHHRDRFEDHSLFVVDEKGQTVALLAANRSEDSLVSHGGLTYGGFITSAAMKLPVMLEVFEVTLEYLHSNGFVRLIYKTVPFFYHQVPAEEDRYALFLCKARLIRRGAMAVSRAQRRPPFQERRRRRATKARQNGLLVRESRDFASFWDILTDRLLHSHNARPVHSLAEVQILHDRFPENIRLFGAFVEDELLAGVVIYESDLVARAQYIATNQRGQELGALDLVLTELLTSTYEAKPYFDFGTSDEENGARLNRGLIDQKEGYGARMVAHDHYEIEVAEWHPGQFTGAMI